MASDLCSCVITVSQVHSGTNNIVAGMNLILWLNIGNDIGFPNERVNMNRLDTY